SEQADRVRQAGEDSGSRESDYYPLCSVPAAAGRLDLAARSGAPASATAGAGARAVGRRCRVLLGGKRTGGTRAGGAAGLHPASVPPQRRPAPAPKETLGPPGAAKH